MWGKNMRRKSERESTEFLQLEDYSFSNEDLTEPESLLANAEDLVENRSDEQNSESDYDDEKHWIYHPTRVLRNRQSAFRPRWREPVLFNQVIRVTGT